MHALVGIKLTKQMAKYFLGNDMYVSKFLNKSNHSSFFFFDNIQQSCFTEQAVTLSARKNEDSPHLHLAWLYAGTVSAETQPTRTRLSCMQTAYAVSAVYTVSSSVTTISSFKHSCRQAGGQGRPSVAHPSGSPRWHSLLSPRCVSNLETSHYGSPGEY